LELCGAPNQKSVNDATRGVNASEHITANTSAQSQRNGASHCRRKCASSTRQEEIRKIEINSRAEPTRKAKSTQARREQRRFAREIDSGARDARRPHGHFKNFRAK